MKFKKVDWKEEKKKINQEQIDWEIDYADLLERDIDERMEVYVANGIGIDSGKEYQGSAILIHRELEKIEDIEEI